MLRPCMVKQIFYIEKLQKAKFHTLDTFETSKYQTALYKLLKNHWVIALFGIFGSVRNKLLVIVFLDHPVPWAVVNQLIGIATRAVRRQKKSRQKRRLVQAPQAPFKAPIHSRCCIGGFRETGLALVIVLRCD